MILELDYKLSGWLFSLGRSLPHEAVIFAAVWLIWILAAYLIFLSFFSSRRQQIFLLSRAVAAVVAVFFIKTTLAWLFLRYRPFVAFDFKPLLQPLFLDQSFPSSHAAIAWALAGSILFHNKKNAVAAVVVAMVMAALVSVGRVLAGVHYLSDILLGGLIGLIVAWLVMKINPKIPPISREQKQ